VPVCRQAPLRQHFLVALLGFQSLELQTYGMMKIMMKIIMMKIIPLLFNSTKKILIIKKKIVKNFAS
jgi:hypothetical protein